MVDAYIGNDLFGCKRGMPFPTFFMLNLLKSPSHVVRQYAARLCNALASLRKGDSMVIKNMERSDENLIKRDIDTADSDFRDTVYIHIFV